MLIVVRHCRVDCRISLSLSLSLVGICWFYFFSVGSDCQSWRVPSSLGTQLYTPAKAVQQSFDGAFAKTGLETRIRVPRERFLVPDSERSNPMLLQVVRSVCQETTSFFNLLLGRWSLPLSSQHCQLWWLVVVSAAATVCCSISAISGIVLMPIPMQSTVIFRVIFWVHCTSYFWEFLHLEFSFPWRPNFSFLLVV